MLPCKRIEIREGDTLPHSNTRTIGKKRRLRMNPFRTEYTGNVIGGVMRPAGEINHATNPDRCNTALQAG